MTAANGPTESTLKRHGYYCRSRNSHTRAVRVRSCVACAKAKTRCDGRSPSCTRCAARNIECRPQADRTADGSSTNVVSKELQLVHRPPRQEFSSSCPFEVSQSAEVNSILNESEPTLVNLDFPSIGIDEFDWNML